MVNYILRIRGAGAPFQAPYTNAATVITANAPTIPATAGSKVTCPTFGTEIMRVTTAADGSASEFFGTVYGYYPSFNRLNDRLLVYSDNANSKMIVYAFNPTTFTLGTKYTLPASPAVRGDFGFWANNSDYLFYAFTVNFQLYEFNFTNPASITSSLIKDFRGVGAIGATDRCWQPLMAADDDTFSLNWQTSGGADKGIAVVKGSTQAVLLAELEANLDETAIARDGTYVVAILHSGAGSSQSSIRTKVFKVSDATIVGLTYGSPDYHSSHATAYGGTGNNYAGVEAYDVGAIRSRSMATPHSNTILRTNGFPASPYNIHMSGLASDGDWIMRNNLAYSQATRSAMDNEVTQLATDGSGNVKRWFNHFSYFDDTSVETYLVQPRATISRDGRYVAFTSNWGTKDGRLDMFIAQLPV